MSAVSVEARNDVAVITLNDGKANAINGDLLTGLEVALDRVENEAKAVVLTGRPGVFSGGLDLKRLPGLPADELQAVLQQFGDTMLRLFSLGRPVVAACGGHAIAGGMVMLLTADERVGAEGAFKLGLNEAAIGLVLPEFVVEMARAQVAAHHLHSIVSAGTLFTPEDALRVGLLTEVLPPEAVLDRALARASALAALPAHAYAGNKLGLRRRPAERGRTAYAEEVRRFTAAFAAAAPAR